MATLYCGPSNTGNGSGSNFSNLLALPNTTGFTRGNTYVIVDGPYSSRTLSTPASGSNLITIRKAGPEDSGVTGYSTALHDGQATIPGTLTISSNYWLLDGNNPLGRLTPWVPIRDTNAYGIKVTMNATDGRNIDYHPYTNITLKNIHSYNAQQGGPSYNGSHRNTYGLDSSYTKYQDCWIQNSFQDGMVLQNTDYLLIERCVLEGLGLLQSGPPDNHGQALQMSGVSNVVIRWNLIVDNEGQGILAFSDGCSTIRVYGNVIWNEHTSGGYYTGANQAVWDHYTSTIANTYNYNNTFVNWGGSYPGLASPNGIFATHSGGSLSGTNVIYNTLFYGVQYQSSAGGIPEGYYAYGSSTTPGGSNNQSGLTSAIFQNYAGSDFRLTGHTTPGLNMSAQGWWNAGAHAFFGQLDYNTDMYGTARSTWDRGAFEFAAGGTPPTGTITLSVR